ncbi:TetR family transcriptional regulator [Streptomyces sp. M19]
MDAALSAENIDTLTMRELSARLGVTHGALYRWVKNRDELLGLISEVIVDRILPAEGPRDSQWRPWLATVAWAMHDQFLAVPGYATRISAPTATTPLLRAAPYGSHHRVHRGGRHARVGRAELVHLHHVGRQLARRPGEPLDLGDSAPRFELFLDTLLRGLPAREPGATRHLG